ncbi:MAG: hypothetical protein HY243_15520 [Proteobacteria bacterium]|nr:hypothetical protein [Pseudomonadota bacterium]
MERFLRALQARRIDRIAAGYAVAGWVLVQAASIAVPTFDAPAWLLKTFIIFVLLGFPITLGTVWFATPHLAGRAARGERLKPIHATALALVAAVIVFVAGDLSYQLAHLFAGSTVQQKAAAPFAPSHASIAVLPFVNMSGDPNKEYFSDGISEELLNDLANTPALRVAARTSSFAFKGKNQDIKQIARLLGVASVLEGSVRESGEHLRITAQLIDAVNGYHLWSKTYDRDLTDVLAVQDEIARAITQALTHALLPAARVGSSQKPTAIDPEAYRAYLLGQHEMGPRTQEGVENALALFEKTTQLAPNFAEGFAALARAQINTSEYHAERTDLIPAAHVSLQRALELDPNNLNALASHLDLALHRLDWKTATADARRMRALNPNSATVLHEMFRYYQIMGFPDLALDTVRSAVILSPLSIVDRFNLAAALVHNARYAEAAAAARAALALQQDNPIALSYLCTASAHSNDLDSAGAIAAKFASMPHQEVSALGCQFDIAVGSGNHGEARRLADDLSKKYATGDFSATDVGDNYAVAGDYPNAAKWLARAYDLKEFALYTIIYDRAIEPDFFQTPGWKKLFARPLFQDWQQAHDALAAELAAKH